jgi:pseudouridine-5'-phosphate glycosidase
LETIGVPVLGLGSNTFPRFIENNLKTDPKVHKVDSPSEVADICKYHWLHLQMDSAILATIPVPNDVALENGTVRETLDRAEHDWAAMHLPSTTRTTFLLNQLANITKGKSLVANLALLCNNAAVAAEIAIELSTTPVSARKH